MDIMAKIKFISYRHKNACLNLMFQTGIFTIQYSSHTKSPAVSNRAFFIYQLAVLQAVIHLKFYRMRRHAQAAYVFFFEGDVAVYPFFAEHTAAG